MLELSAGAHVHRARNQRTAWRNASSNESLPTGAPAARTTWGCTQLRIAALACQCHLLKRLTNLCAELCAMLSNLLFCTRVARGKQSALAHTALQPTCNDSSRRLQASLSAGSGVQTDAMAANELRAHARLQPPAVPAESNRLLKLLGGLVVQQGASRGEQWLLFRNQGIQSAAQYASLAAEAFARGKAVGEGEFFDRWDKARPLKQRRVFVKKVRTARSPSLCSGTYCASAAACSVASLCSDCVSAQNASDVTTPAAHARSTMPGTLSACARPWRRQLR
jgi:hypothetical protein